MNIELIEGDFSVCKVADFSGISTERPFVFTARTDQEYSLVCPTSIVPANTIEREDGWNGMRVTGVLEFSLIGILARISSLLANAGISIFALSTYNTDYILVKKENLDKAVTILEQSGITISKIKNKN